MNKKEQVYVRLLEAGEVLVPVEATKLNAEYYLITENKFWDNTDPTSIWEFFPGDFVKCEIENGKLVANELLRTSIQNRKIHTLIFKIVKNLTKLDEQSLKSFSKETKLLCNKSFRLEQKQHPMVKKWIKDNCDKN